MPEVDDPISESNPEPALILQCAGSSDVGLLRSRNEDALWIDTARGYLLLADGMGGYRGGDVAAALAVSHVLNRLQRVDEAGDVADCVDALSEGIDEANTAIRSVAAANEELWGMGATVVAAIVNAQRIVHAHVGDSRLYRLRDACLEQLTHDHTLLQEQIAAGLVDAKVARMLPYRGLLTRGLGVTDEVRPDIGIHELKDGDRFLLCSDGLTDMLDDIQIAAVLGGDGGPADVAQRLIDMANDCGGRDNVSVIVAWFSV